VAVKVVRFLFSPTEASFPFEPFFVEADFCMRLPPATLETTVDDVS